MSETTNRAIPVDIQGLKVRYGRNEAVSGVDLLVGEPGSVFVLLGPKRRRQDLLAFLPRRAEAALPRHVPLVRHRPVC